MKEEDTTKMENSGDCESPAPYNFTWEMMNELIPTPFQSSQNLIFQTIIERNFALKTTRVNQLHF